MKNAEKLALQNYINIQSSQGNMYFIGGIIMLSISIIALSLSIILLSIMTIILGIIYIIICVIYCAKMYKRTKKLEKIKEMEYKKAIEELNILPKMDFYLGHNNTFHGITK